MSVVQVGFAALANTDANRWTFRDGRLVGAVPSDHVILIAVAAPFHPRYRRLEVARFTLA
jgi:hypothetical protein